ncbi:polyphosphate polymerase domain-containing protein [Frigoriglobus tundricola]|uniref:VTC domain-containing protein n=1 Tax=Frigoriglobus tundricola TaxID=2774151 RepID=A0A6M5Z337_9BACT|nr:polyphosphate polymerase domain-containing protein [Frigoriglobus tundricola]QJX00115.1 hypothetical protein FTUN_7739 [Frigoriglobus tundricola]
MSDLFDSMTGAVTSGSSATPREPASVLESPSLFGPDTEAGSATAYEVKFLLGEDQVREIVGRVAGHLALDPYADPARGNAYQTTSVYTDTPTFDVFHRTDGYDRDKFRVRRYGAAGPVFVERKSKNGDKVRKHRSKIDAREVADLAAAALNGEWAGEWFHSQLIEKQLRPICRVAYERVAYLGTADGGTVRVTFDRNIRGVLADQWALEAVGTGAPVLTDRVVCEFKFRTAMPALLKGIVADLNLVPARFSKYRNFVLSTGLVPVAAPAESAGAQARDREAADV